MGLRESHVFMGFLYFYKTIYKNETLNNNKYESVYKQECSLFLKLLETEYTHIDRLGADFLWLYFNYQFQRLSLRIDQYPDKRITLKMIIGKRPFEKFVERKVNLDFLVLQKSSTLNKNVFIKIVNLQQNNSKHNLYDPDELYREQLLNTNIGLSNCIVYTSLYNPNSQSCQNCKFTLECINVQKQMYRRIYRDRKIDGIKATTR